MLSAVISQAWFHSVLILILCGSILMIYCFSLFCNAYEVSHTVWPWFLGPPLELGKGLKMNSMSDFIQFLFDSNAICVSERVSSSYAMQCMHLSNLFQVTRVPGMHTPHKPKSNICILHISVYSKRHIVCAHDLSLQGQRGQQSAFLNGMKVMGKEFRPLHILFLQRKQSPWQQWTSLFCHWRYEITVNADCSRWFPLKHVKAGLSEQPLNSKPTLNYEHKFIWHTFGV